MSVEEDDALDWDLEERDAFMDTFGQNPDIEPPTNILVQTDE